MDSIIQYLLTILTTLCAFLLLIYYYHHQFRNPNNGKTPLPRARGAMPIIGHLHHFGSNQLVHKTLGAMAEKYGPVFTIKLGSQENLVVSSWEVAKECFTTLDKAFSDRPKITATRILGYNFAMFGLAPYGPYWREMRKIATLELLSHRRIDMFSHIRVSEVRTSLTELHNSWGSKTGLKPGLLVDMRQWFGDITLNSSVRLVGGKRFVGSGEEGEGRSHQKVMRDFLYFFGVFVLSDAIPWLGWSDLQGHEKSMKRIAKELDGLIGKWLEEHKQRRRIAGEGRVDQDFMDVMLSILETADFTKDFDADTITKSTCLVFDGFKSDKGEFKASLGEDTKGLLQLYEASFLLTEGEESLEAARDFSTNILQKKVDDNGVDDDVSILMVRNALELPLHWRNQRLNARWFIDAYASTGADMNPLVLQLAKLDFNILQATYQEELKHVLRWWEQSRLAKKLPFARDRLVECYAWGLGQMSPPQYGYARIINTKVNMLATVIDDMFDVYGTLEELQAFNNIVQRWDIEAMEQLPEYMQICFLALNNFVDEMAYDVLKEQGFLILTYLRKLWADICNSCMKEAEWYSRGYTPTMEEYIGNSWFSIGAPVMLSHEFFAITNPITKEAIESLFKYHDILRYSGLILRLTNDLGTSQDEMERGDTPKSVQCYMNENGVGSEEARENIKFLIRETWKKLNKEAAAESLFSRDFVRGAADLGRTAHYMYQYGDGLGVQASWIQHRISTLLFEPLSLA